MEKTTRIQKIYNYLDKLDGLSNLKDIKYRELFTEIHKAYPDTLDHMDLSYMGETEEPSVLFCWDKNKHHFEIELMFDNQLECFYRNRDTGLTDFDDYNWNALNNALEFSDEYLKLLSL